MRRCTLSLFALLLGSLQLVAQPTVKTNYANLTLTNTCDGSWSDFNFQVSGYDNQAYHFTYSGIDLTKNIKFGFRLAKPMGGPIYNEIPFTEFTTTANTIRWTIAHTNIPPTGVYYGELLAYSASGTNVYRSLAQGKVNVTWSLYLIDEDYFAVVSKTGASVGQVYVHPTWRVPPWSETEQVVAIQSDLDAHKTNTDVHAIAAVTGLQDVLDGKSGTGDVAQVATDLSEHKSAIGIAVHGLGTMSTQETDDYYTAESVDTLLIGKQDAGDYQASSTNLDAWSGVGPGAYYDSSEVDTILVGKASTGDMATAESDISNLQSEMSSVTGNVAVLETWTNVVIDTSNRVAALEGYTNEVLSLTGRVEILSTQIFAGAGTTGLVTSAAGDADKFLKSDGTWTTPEGEGDFKADGSVPMTGNMDHGGHYVTNFGVARGATGIFENALSVGGSAVLTNEPEWEASSSVVMRVVADFGGVSNLAYNAGTLTNMLSSDGSIVWQNAGGPQPDGSVTSAVANWSSYLATQMIDQFVEGVGAWYYSGETVGLPLARSYSASAALGSNVYVIGGIDDTYNPTTNVYKFDGSTWTEVEGMPGAKDGMAVSTIGNNIYVIAGYGGEGEGVTTNVYKFDGSTWTEVEGLPVAREFPAAASIGNNIYTIGGQGGGATTNVYKFDGSTWTEVEGLPEARYELAAAAIGTNIYAIGGTDSDGIATTNVYKFDGSTWTEVEGLPATRCSLAAATPNSNIYVIGGYEGGSGTTNVYKFDGSTWTEVEGLPVAKGGIVASSVGSNVYVTGGYATNVYVFSVSPDVITNSFGFNSNGLFRINESGIEKTPAYTNELHIVETNAEAARAIATNALHIAGTALQPGAAGTSTNLGDYNNDAGFITEDTDTNAVWGNISGTMSNQVDLQGALNGKAGTNDLHIVETNAEAARAIATNALENALKAMTNFNHVASPTNWLSYDPATRTLSGCVTNEGLTTSDVQLIEPLMTDSEDVVLGSGAVYHIYNGLHDGVAIGRGTEGQRRSVTVGAGTTGGDYSVAVGAYAQAAASSVAIGYGITNPTPGTTRILGHLDMVGSNVQGVGTLDTTNLTIKGGSPSSGAVWTAQSASGDGAWGQGAWEIQLPAGVITMWAATNAPTGWLVCDGSSVSTNDYPALYAAIGHNYGGSGGNFNLPNLNQRFPKGGTNGLAATGGAATVTLTSNQIPAHAHSVNPPATTSGTNSVSHKHAVDPPSTDTSTAGAHTHTLYYCMDTAAGSAKTRLCGAGESIGNTPTTSDGNHTHTVDISSFNSGYASGHTHSTDIAAFNSVESGGGAAHENEPPYLVVNYIIKY